LPFDRAEAAPTLVEIFFEQLYSLEPDRQEFPADSHLVERLGVKRSLRCVSPQINGSHEFLLDTDLPSRWVLYRETPVKTSTGEVLVAEAWAADQLLVRKKAEIQEGQFLGHLQTLGFGFRRHLVGTDVYVVSSPFREGEFSELTRAIQTLRNQEAWIMDVEADAVVSLFQESAQEPFLLDDEQWPLTNTGRGGGVPGADVDALPAWIRQPNADNVLVAVVDTGVNYLHQDLRAVMWFNAGETPDNGIDDDGNGYVDDVFGIDTHNRDGDPGDDNGHGSHVAGIIAADGSNGVGMTGLAPGSKIMALKFLSGNGGGLTSNALEAIGYARVHGAEIINMSWGSATRSQVLFDLLQDCARDGILLVSAAGNRAENIDFRPAFPAAFPLERMLTVASTDAWDRLSGFSNFGASTVHLAAPGSNVLSTWTGSADAYSRISGTSMAAPHVAAALALLRAAYPSDTPDALLRRTLNGCEFLPSLIGKVRSQGRLNLHRALLANDRPLNDLPADAFLSRLHAVEWTDSTVTATGPEYGLEASVWYQWAPPASGRAILSLNTGHALSASVFSGSSPESLLSASLPLSPGNHPLTVQKGVSVWVAVHGAAPAPFQLALSVAPENDDRNRAFITQGEAWTTRGSNLGSTPEKDETDLNVGATRSVWWKWTAPATGAVRLHTEGSDYDTVLAVYSDNPLEGIIRGENPDVLFVIDVSGSTHNTFEGFNAGDLNRDGRRNSVLDAEIGASLSILRALNLKRYFPSARAAILPFHGSAWMEDINPSLSGPQWIGPVGADADLNGIEDIPDILASLRAGGMTNFEAALQQALIAFDLISTPPGNRNLIFLSDGHPTEGGDFRDEVEALRFRDVNMRAFGAGLGASLEDLRHIDPQALIFLTGDELLRLVQGAIAFNDDAPGLITSEVNFAVRQGTTYWFRVDGFDGETGNVRLSLNMYDGLEILRQPEALAVERGGEGRLDLEVRGVPPLHYQWYRDGQPLHGQTASHLDFSNMEASLAGSYQVRVSNRIGQVDSLSVAVQMVEYPPRFVREPDSLRVPLGASARLVTEIGGTPPFTLEWLHNGNLLPGADLPHLDIVSAGPEHEGTYQIRVRNAAGDVLSKAATLETTDAPFSHWRVVNGNGPLLNPIALKYHGGFYYAFSSSGEIHRTRDSVFWETKRILDYAVDPPEGGLTVNQVLQRGNIFVIKAYNVESGAVIFHTQNGVTWKETRLPGLSFSHIEDCGDHWLALVRDGYDSLVYTSTDLDTWTKIPEVITYYDHVLVPAGSIWAHYTAGAPSTTYTSTTFNDSSWSRGPGKLGFGMTGLATTIPNVSNQPKAYFRHVWQNTPLQSGYRLRGRLRHNDQAYVRLGSALKLFDDRTTPVVAKPNGYGTDWIDIPPFNQLLNFTQLGDTPSPFTVEVSKSGSSDTSLCMDLEITGRINHSIYGPSHGATRTIALRTDGLVYFTDNGGLSWQNTPATGDILTQNTLGQTTLFLSEPPLWHNGRFIAWRSNVTPKRWYSSIDGIHWTLHPWPRVPSITNTLIDLPVSTISLMRDGSRLFQPSARIYHSEDGITWEADPVPSTSPGNIQSSQPYYIKLLTRVESGWMSAYLNNQYSLAQVRENLPSVNYPNFQGASHFKVIGGRLWAFRRYLTSAFDARPQSTNDGLNWTSPSLGQMSDAVLVEGTLYVIGFQNAVQIWAFHKGEPVFPADKVYAWPFTWVPRALTHHNGLFIAAGTKGGIATSPNARDWTLVRESSDLQANLNHACVLNGTFLALGETGQLVLSDDLNHFELVYPAPGLGTLRAIAHGNGRFVLCGDNNGTATSLSSPDARSWTTLDHGSLGDFTGIDFADGWFVGVAGNTVLSSRDGLTWNQSRLQGNRKASAVAHWNGRFWIAGGDAPATSHFLWQPEDQPLAAPPVLQPLDLPAVFTFNQPFRVDPQVTSDTPLQRVDYFLNGELWHSRNSPPWHWSHPQIPAGNHLLTVKVYNILGVSTQVHHSFSVQFPPGTPLMPSDLQFVENIKPLANGQLVGYGTEVRGGTNYGPYIAFSHDGSTWIPSQEIRELQNVNRVSSLDQLHNGHLLAQIDASTGRRQLHHSSDGQQWTLVQDIGSFTRPLLTLPDGVLCLPTHGASALYSPNGISWSPLTLTLSADIPFTPSWTNSLIFSWKKQYFAYSRTQPSSLVSSDGLTWSLGPALAVANPHTRIASTDTFAVAWSFQSPGTYQAFVSREGLQWSPLSHYTDKQFRFLTSHKGSFFGTDNTGLWQSENLVDWVLLADNSGERSYLLNGSLFPLYDTWVWAELKTVSLVRTRTIATSSNLRDWELRQDWTNQGPQHLATDGQTLVVLQNSALVVSRDGFHWTRRPSPLASVTGIGYAEGNWILLGKDPATNITHIARSANLSDWVSRPAPAPSLPGLLNGNWLVLGANKLYHSPDMETWTEQTSAEGRPLSGIQASKIQGGRFVLFTQDGLFSSTDAQNWKWLADPYGASTSFVPTNFHWGQEGFSFVNTEGKWLHTSTDLQSWTPVDVNQGYHIAPALSAGNVGLAAFPLHDIINPTNSLNITQDGGWTWKRTGLNVDNVYVAHDAVFSAGYTTVSAIHLVDFVVENVEIHSQANPGPNVPIDIQLTVRNRGFLDYSGQRDIRVRVVISPRAEDSGINTQTLAEWEWPYPLALEEARELLLENVYLPRDLGPGPYHVGVIFDARHQVFELNEENNQYFSPEPLFTVQGFRLTLASTPGGSVGTGSDLPGSLTQSSGGFQPLASETWLSSNTLLDLLAMPHKGYRFSGWLESPGSGLSPLRVLMKDDLTLTPLFEPLLSVTTAADPGGQIVHTPAMLNDLAPGSLVTLSPQPDPGWAFLSWDGDLDGNAPSLSFLAQRSLRVRARFYKLQIRYDDWKKEHFNPYEQIDPARSGPLVSLAQGVPNLTRYFFRETPETPVSRHLRLEEGSLQFETDPRIVDYHAVLMHSTNLLDWTPANLAPSVDTPAYNLRRVRFPAPPPGADSQPLFYRLEILPASP
jgi:subtilisin family serine protease